MTKTIKEAAKDYAYDIGDSDWERMRLQDAFIDGINHIMQLPLCDRLTAEEKEQIRFAHKAAKTFAERTNPMSAEVFKGQYLLLESIFGSDFFKDY